MSKSIFRRFTFSKQDNSGPQILTNAGETAPKAVKSLLKSLEAYMDSKCPEKLDEIGTRVGLVWSSVFDTEKETAPQKKYELAEELLLRPDIMKLLLVAFQLVHIDVKRKIRDLYVFIVTWCSNDSAESCVPRSRSKSKFNPKIRDLLFHCRFEVMAIVDEGYDMAGSLGFYNDIIREFVRDEDCLMSLFEDNGYDAHNFQRRAHGCIWAVFERLTRTNDFRAFDVIMGTFETLQMLFDTNHNAVHTFINQNLIRFMQSMHNLIAMSNFYVQGKSLRFLYDIFTAQRHYETRTQWMAEPAFIKLVVLALQSRKKAVRMEAVPLLELFVENPENSPDVHEFIGMNSIVLIKYCLDNTPLHFYRGNVIEQEDARFARIIYKLLNWNIQRPFTREQLKEFEEGRRLQKKMHEEQTVPTRYQDFVPGLPTANHEYNIKSSGSQPFLREPIRFGKPFETPNSFSNV